MHSTLFYSNKHQIQNTELLDIVSFKKNQIIIQVTGSKEIH